MKTAKGREEEAFLLLRGETFVTKISWAGVSPEFVFFFGVSRRTRFQTTATCFSRSGEFSP